MTSDIVVYGIGGTSRHIVETLEAINDDGPHRRWNILGFVDDNAELAGGEVIGYPVLGGGLILRTPVHARTQVVIGISNDRNLTVRKAIRDYLDSPDDRFPAILHPNVVHSKRSTIGAGSVLLAGSSLESLSSIGRHVIILSNSVVGHDIAVEDYVSIASNVVIGGFGRIGEFSYIGQGAVTRPPVKVGRMCRVGMGAAVLHDVPDGVTVAGVPAREIRSKDPRLAGAGKTVLPNG